MRAGRVAWMVVGLGLAGSGCRAPVTIIQNGTPAPTINVPVSLDTVAAQRIEPDYKSLPKADPNAVLARETFTYRGLDEKSTQLLAAANSSLANLLDAENAKASVLGVVKRKGTVNVGRDDLLRETRRLAAVDARNRSAADALERYLQLADAAGRQQLFVAGIDTFDQLRKDLPRIRDAGLPTPKDDELMQQRAVLMADLIKIDAGIALLNHDLVARLGYNLEASEQFWPLGDFGIFTDAIDADVAVTRAIAERPDLQAIRTLRDRLTVDTLPTAREALQTISGFAGAPSLPGPLSFFARLKECIEGPTQNPLDKAEVESRRKQLTELLNSREAEAAAQVRTSIGQMTAAAKRVAQLRARADSMGEKLTKDKADKLLADIPTSETNYLKARADVLAAVLEWHQWRVRLKAAMGMLVNECFEGEPPRNPAPASGLVPVRVYSPHRLTRPSR